MGPPDSFRSFLQRYNIYKRFKKSVLLIHLHTCHHRADHIRQLRLVVYEVRPQHWHTRTEYSKKTGHFSQKHYQTIDKRTNKDNNNKHTLGERLFASPRTNGWGFNSRYGLYVQMVSQFILAFAGFLRDLRFPPAFKIGVRVFITSKTPLQNMVIYYNFIYFK